MFDCLINQYKLWRLYKKKLIQKLQERQEEVQTSSVSKESSDQIQSECLTLKNSNIDDAEPFVEKRKKSKNFAERFGEVKNR